jgi:uncharacterized membrane protein YfcA
MPFHRPIPEARERRGASGVTGALVQAEKLVQIVLVLPCGAFIGWLIGAWLDSRLHQSWISMAGIVFGIVSGLLAAVRMALHYGAGSKTDGAPRGGSGNENPRQPQ